MLFIYSGEVMGLDRRLRYELGESHRLITIPCSPAERCVADEARDYFQACGVNAYALSCAEYRDPVQLRNAIFTADAVYLCGGNTYQFLEYAREIGLFSLLLAFEALGGIIVTESAGSIILCPNIATAAIPTSCPDENSTGVTDFHAMGRIPFHVSPHYEPESLLAAADLVELQALADGSDHSVLVLQDGEGVVLKDEQVIFSVGEPRWLEPKRDPLLAATPPPAFYTENVLAFTANR